MAESQQIDPGAQRDAFRSGDDWASRFPGLDKAKVFDLVTSMFLDCADEEYIARALSDHFGAGFTSASIRHIRFEAAMEADKMESAESRKKWIFRYRHLTLNNLVKEYMFISRGVNFFESKVELADEVYWLTQKHSKTKLWIALNDALGRNNVPESFIEELLEFRESMLRVKQLIGGRAKERGIDVSELLLEVSQKVADAYGRYQENSVKTGDYACDLLGLKRGSLAAADIKYLREYFKCSKFPERTDSESLTRLIEGADVLLKRNVLDEAASGNIANLTAEDLEHLLKEMKASPVLKPERLERIGGYVSRKLEGGATDAVFGSLKELILAHLGLTDINKFHTRPELKKLLAQKVSENDLSGTLKELNSLARSNEVASYLRTVVRGRLPEKAAATFASKYFKQRFGVEWG